MRETENTRRSGFSQRDFLGFKGISLLRLAHISCTGNGGYYDRAWQPPIQIGPTGNCHLIQGEQEDQ
jgi:hypothetical protein